MLKELAPFHRRPFRTTDRSTVNPRGFHCDKEVSVKSRISRYDCLIALFAIQCHIGRNWSGLCSCLAIFGHENALVLLPSATLVNVRLCFRRTEQSRAIRLHLRLPIFKLQRSRIEDDGHEYDSYSGFAAPFVCRMNRDGSNGPGNCRPSRKLDCILPNLNTIASVTGRF